MAKILRQRSKKLQNFPKQFKNYLGSTKISKTFQESQRISKDIQESLTTCFCQSLNFCPNSSVKVVFKRRKTSTSQWTRGKYFRISKNFRFSPTISQNLSKCQRIFQNLPASPRIFQNLHESPKNDQNHSKIS